MNPIVTHPLFSVSSLRPRVLSIALTLLGCMVSTVALDAAEPPSFSFREDFSGKEGAPLNRTRPAGAPASWVASPNLSFVKTDGKGAVGPTQISGFHGRVPLPSGTSGRITVEATLRAVTPAEKMDWVALGLGNPAISEKSSIRWPQGVFVILRPNGGYTLFLSPDGELDNLIPVKNGILANTVSKPVVVRLVYNARLQTLSLMLDGKAVVQNYELANRNVFPTPLAAGFSGFGQTPGTASVTAFKVEIDSGR